MYWVLYQGITIIVILTSGKLKCSRLIWFLVIFISLTTLQSSLSMSRYDLVDLKQTSSTIPIVTSFYLLCQSNFEPSRFCFSYGSSYFFTTCPSINVQCYSIICTFISTFFFSTCVQLALLYHNVFIIPVSIFMSFVSSSKCAVISKYQDLGIHFSCFFYWPHLIPELN